MREALRLAVSEYKLSSLRYDLWKLRAQGLVEKVPHSHRYRLPAMGYRLCLVYLKLFEKIYAPLTAGLLAPFGGDRALPPNESLSWTGSTSASSRPWTSCSKLSD